MFNAIRYTQELEKAGFTREQAEISVKLLIDTMNENFAMKSDLNELEATFRSEFVLVHSDVKEFRTHVDAEFGAVRSEMKEFKSQVQAEFTAVRSEMKDLEYRLVTRLGGLMTALFGIAVALIKIH